MTASPHTIDSLRELLLSVPPHQEAEALEAVRQELTEEEVEQLIASLPLWRPQPGPQTEALHSEADILFFGGQAGGGKTDLALGLAATQHYESIIFRRTFKQLDSIVKRSLKLYGQVAEYEERIADYNKSEHVWTFRDGRVVEVRQVQHEHDKEDYQGQPHDFYVFDEGPQFPESVVRFIIGWLRSTRHGQRCRVLITGNPPTDSDGEWVVRFFAAWLDPSHPSPAKPGELRWFATVLENGKPREIEVAKDWRGVDEAGDTIIPLSRTFIPAKLSDNRFQMPAYRAVLQSLPEPLRSQMLFGNFQAGREDNAYQAIPSAWVDAAQKRWRDRVATIGKPKTPMTALGVDVARGGRDFTVRAPRYGNFVDELRRAPGANTPDGQAAAGLIEADIIGHPGCLVQVDVIGVGGSVIDCLTNGWVDKAGDQHPGIDRRAVAMNASEGSEETDKSGTLGFVNQRAAWTWGVREALDPASGQDICLPPDPQIKADLCALRWKLTPRGIKIELKDEVKERIGRSPDDGDAVINALAVKHVLGTGLLDYARIQMEKLAAAKAAKG